MGQTLDDPLLRVEGLTTHFHVRGTVVRAVDGVSFDVRTGEIIAIVGESGSGKSVTALSILQLIRPPGRIVSGRVLYRGRDLVGMPEREVRAIRGAEVSMIFQEPMSSLNPVLTCGQHIVETLRAHQRMPFSEARARAVALLELVGIPSAAQRVDEYPHQLSGGMRQRVMIAMALACRPAILIADEPTTALDVTIQAQIIELLRTLQADLQMAVVLITHDLGLVAETADRVVVMYAGQIVEECDVRSAFRRPLHPYTAALQASLPRLGARRERLAAIPGSIPTSAHFPRGCRFHPRCPVALDECLRDPELFPFPDARRSRCFRAGEIAEGTLNPVRAEGLRQ